MKFEEIWDHYQTHLKSFLYSRVTDSDEVEDLLQSILIKVYEKHHTIKSEDSLQSWLFQIARNTIIDYYRQQGRRQTVIDIDQENVDNFEQLNNNLEVLQVLEKCIEPFIAALPEEYERLLNAIDIEGESQKEYADRHGLTYSTLKSRVQKARSELHKMFTACCHFSMDQRGNLMDYERKSDHCTDC